ncbi:uncharacterized protein LOC129729276 [Wyeomyia smithii]|uniref:uncharacterized protein LOC129729276 n=1 Tax=Wyeomyia smithii TaxID=174621 RepID=UPI0024680EAF|nr:uncharacterized protein LOC129729276 [Wyeomyia smithii]
MAKAKEALAIEVHGIYYWTDSMVTLDWISNPTKKRPTFISNRVRKINDMSPIENWNHVGSKENPADLISRGTSTQKLAESTIWWKGPAFLEGRDRTWTQRPSRVMITQEQQQVDSRCEVNYLLLDRYSKLEKLQRVVAYCLRFKRNCHIQQIERETGPLTLKELDDAQLCIVRMAQTIYFATEIQLLKKNKSLPSSSTLITLQPFLDDRQVLRVEGRIQAAGVEFNQQHPIILSSKCKLAYLLAVYYHLENLHGLHCISALESMKFKNQNKLSEYIDKQHLKKNHHSCSQQRNKSRSPRLNIKPLRDPQAAEVYAQQLEAALPTAEELGAASLEDGWTISWLNGFADDCDIIARNFAMVEETYTRLKAEAKRIGLLKRRREQCQPATPDHSRRR